MPVSRTERIFEQHAIQPNRDFVDRFAGRHLLPDQLQQLREVARLQLPTGGVYVYKYLEAGCQANGNSGVLTLANNSGYRIYRRLQERDEYSDGTNPSAKIVFPAPATNASNGDPNHGSRPTTNVEVDFEDASNNVMRKELHYFYGNPGSTQPPPSDPTTYAAGGRAWSSGRMSAMRPNYGRVRRGYFNSVRAINPAKRVPASTRSPTRRRRTIRRCARRIARWITG